MVSSRTPGVNNITDANDATNSRAEDAASSHDGAGVSVGEDESRVNTVPDSCSDGGSGANVGWSQSGPPSLSMSVDLHNLVTSTNHQDSGRYSVSPDHAGETTASTAVVKVGCYDEEESYEGFGSVEGDADDGPESPGGSSSAPSPTGTSSRRNPRSPNSTVGRHSWLRTSLRKTPPCSGRKRLSSNALASQLYRSGSFNSSGIGSNYDPADDVYSDVSLEDMMDLNHKTATRKKDATQNYPAMLSKRTSVNDDDELRKNGSYALLRENDSESSSSSVTDTVMKTFVNPIYEDDDRDDDIDDENAEEESINIRTDVECMPSRKIPPGYIASLNFDLDTL